MEPVEGGLRKAAVFVQSLERQTAELVLEQMPPQLACQIREALTHVDSIGTDERERIIQEFMQADQPEPELVDDAVEINPTLVERLARGDDFPDDEEEALDAPIEPVLSIGPPEPFAFLDVVATADIARYCGGEHPQTISIILSFLPPGRAAEVLRSLPPDEQADVLRRMARLGEPDAMVLDEIQQQMQQALQRSSASAAGPDSTRLARIEAILRAAHAGQREQLREQLVHADQQLAESLTWASCPAAATDEVRKPRPEPVEPPEKERLPHFDFDDLVGLDDTTLSKLFRSADPQIILLALSGASSQFVDRILAQVPLRDARLLRRQILDLGPTRLRDIELAQSQLVEMARRLDDEGTIRLPFSTQRESYCFVA